MEPTTVIFHQGDGTNNVDGLLLNNWGFMADSGVAIHKYKEYTTEFKIDNDVENLYINIWKSSTYNNGLYYRLDNALTGQLTYIDNNKFETNLGSVMSGSHSISFYAGEGGMILDVNGTYSIVPEPSSILLTILAFGFLFLKRKRRNGNVDSR